MKGTGSRDVKGLLFTTPNWRGFLHRRAVLGVLHGPMDPAEHPWFWLFAPDKQKIPGTFSLFTDGSSRRRPRQTPWVCRMTSYGPRVPDAGATFPEDELGHRGFWRRPKGSRSPPRPSSNTALLSAFMPSPGRLTSLATIQSSFFSSSLRRAPSLQVVRLGGEPHHDLPRPLARGEGFQNVDGRHQDEPPRPAAFPELLGRDGLRAVIGHRGHGNKEVALRKKRFAHLRTSPRRTPRGCTFTPARRRQLHRAAHQVHPPSARRGGLRQRVTHPAARSIAQKPHRIEMLAGRSGGDQAAKAVAHPAIHTATPRHVHPWLSLRDAAAGIPKKYLASRRPLRMLTPCFGSCSRPISRLRLRAMP